MYRSTHSALIIATLLVVASCSGGASSQASPPLNEANAFVHRGVPFMPPALHSFFSRAVSPTYPTRKSMVFEADEDEAAVNIYKTKSLASDPPPIASIHVAAGCPFGLARDMKGTLYVADSCGGNDVEEYPKGSTTMKAKITNGISNPLGLAIDSTGTLYVSNYPPSITVYPFGSSTPSETITAGLTDPFGLALDDSNNLYIADFGADAVFELPHGSTTIKNLNLQGAGEPLGLAIDQTYGYLWETDGGGNAVNVYELGGSTSPIETFAGHGQPYAISLEQVGRPKREVVESDLGDNDVYAYKPGQYKPFATLNNGIELPTGLLIDKP